MDNLELEKIYKESYRAVYWTAMSLLRDEDEAQDIVQDTYVTLIGSFDSLKDRDNLTGWLKKVAANKCLNRITRNRTTAVGDEILEEIEAVPEDFLPDQIVEDDEKRRIIMDIIDKALSDEVRRTIILYYFDEMTTGEIAEALGIPQGTVLWRLNFARKKIKKEVERYENENNDKLYAMALPFLSKLFIREAENVPLRPMPASFTTPSASEHAPDAARIAKTAAGKAESKIAEASAKGAGAKMAAVSADIAGKGTGFMLKKIIIGAVVLSLGSAGTVGVVHYVTKKNASDDKPRETVVITEADPDEEVLGDVPEDTYVESAPSDTDMTAETSEAEVTQTEATEDNAPDFVLPDVLVDPVLNSRHLESFSAYYVEGVVPVEYEEGYEQGLVRANLAQRENDGNMEYVFLDDNMLCNPDEPIPVLRIVAVRIDDEGRGQPLIDHGNVILIEEVPLCDCNPDAWSKNPFDRLPEDDKIYFDSYAGDLGGLTPVYVVARREATGGVMFLCHNGSPQYSIVTIENGSAEIIYSFDVNELF